MTEGSHVDHWDNLIWSTFVDFRDPAQRSQITRLVKGCRKEHAIEVSHTVLISKPGRFREFGESLIRDLGEAFASHEQITYEAVEDQDHLAEAHERDAAVNRTYELVGVKGRTNTTSVRRTCTSRQSLTSGKNGWMFCAAVEPATPQEWELWRATLEGGYDHVSYIGRPREFARALASMVAEQLGPRGKTTYFNHTFDDIPRLRTEHTVQTLFHGPVIYVDDVHSAITSAATPLETALLPLFVKATECRDQREYRFAIYAETEPTQETELLTASPSLVGTMDQEGSSTKTQIMPPAEYIDDEPAREDDDFDDQDETYDEEPYEEFRRRNPSLLDQTDEGADTIHSFPRTLMELASDPATPLRPNKIDPNEPLPDGFSALTTSYSAVVALQNKVNRVSDSHDIAAQRKLEAASAAWYAEQHIRSVCEAFEDPISGISITPDSYVVVEVSLRDHQEIACKMAVAPSGECAVHLEAERRQSTVTVESTWPRTYIGQTVREFLEEAASPRDLSDDTPLLQEPP